MDLTMALQRNFTLQAQQLSWGRMTQSELDWLRSNGVSCEAIMRPEPISAASVRYEGSHFELDADGARAITIPVSDGGSIIDIAAWQPKTNKLATYHGSAFCLNPDAVFRPSTYSFGGALHVHSSVLGWLKDGRTGIVIIRPELAYGYLAARERLSVDTAAEVETLRRLMRPPKPRARIYVRRQDEEEVAA